MKKLLIISALFILATFSAYAQEPGLAINTVTMQLKAEQWLVTKTALVTVTVNAAVSEQGIEKIQNDILLKLNHIAKADWHITSFNRQQDRTGLEGIVIHAQGRIAQTDLGNLRNGAKSVSKAGETFTIENVDFTPTEEEIRDSSAALRNDIYQQAKREVEVLNTVYPTQRYYLHQIDFTQPPVIMPIANYAKTAVAAAPAVSSPLGVGNKAELQATVVIASIPELPSNLPRTH